MTKYRNYLFDLGFLIKERALQAKMERDHEQKGTEAYTFEAGRVMAFVEVITLMQGEAKVFEIPLEELRLEGFSPERDLL